MKCSFDQNFIRRGRDAAYVPFSNRIGMSLGLTSQDLDLWDVARDVPWIQYAIKTNKWYKYFSPLLFMKQINATIVNICFNLIEQC